MGKCRLLIEIPGEAEGADAWVPPGGALDVVVHVEVDAEVECKSLTLERFWRTSGRGDRNTGKKRSIEVFSGTWAPGHYSYPVQVVFGRKVSTYHGKHIQLDWHLRAQADIPWALDPKDQRTVLVVPRPAPPYEPPPAPVLTPVKMSGDFNGCMIPAVLGIMIAAGLFGFGHPLYASILGFVAALAFLKSIQDRARTKRLGEVSLGVWPNELLPGSELRAFVEIAPESDIQLNEIRVKLVAQEVVSSGSGTDRTTYRHDALKVKQVVDRDLHIRSSEPYRGETALQIPADAPPTLDASSNKIQWTLTLQVKLPSDRTQEHELPLIVRASSSGPPEEEAP